MSVTYKSDLSSLLGLGLKLNLSGLSSLGTVHSWESVVNPSSLFSLGTAHSQKSFVNLSGLSGLGIAISYSQESFVNLSGLSSLGIAHSQNLAILHSFELGLAASSRLESAPTSLLASRSIWTRLGISQAQLGKSGRYDGLLVGCKDPGQCSNKVIGQLNILIVGFEYKGASLANKVINVDSTSRQYWQIGLVHDMQLFYSIQLFV